MSEFQKILDCEHDFDEIGGIRDCMKCGISEHSLNWVHVIVNLEAQRDELLAACELVMYHSEDYQPDCTCEVCVAVRTAIANVKENNDTK